MQIPTKQIDEIDHAEAGRIIRALRLKKSLRQKEISEALGISISMLSALESGTRDWTRERFDAAVKAINETPAFAYLRRRCPALQPRRMKNELLQ